MTGGGMCALIRAGRASIPGRRGHDPALRMEWEGYRGRRPLDGYVRARWVACPVRADNGAFVGVTEKMSTAAGYGGENMGIVSKYERNLQEKDVFP